jgi:hypothetical protein
MPEPLETLTDADVVAEAIDCRRAAEENRIVTYCPD